MLWPVKIDRMKGEGKIIQRLLLRVYEYIRESIERTVAGLSLILYPKFKLHSILVPYFHEFLFSLFSADLTYTVYLLSVRHQLEKQQC